MILFHARIGRARDEGFYSRLAQGDVQPRRSFHILWVQVVCICFGLIFTLSLEAERELS
jgi:hypothetical protein